MVSPAFFLLIGASWFYQHGLNGKFSILQLDDGLST
jgi:hypothetical protein